MKKLFLAFTCLFAVTANAQEINYGLDINSQYVWRGLQLDNAVSLQPTVEFKVRNFTIGTWGNYSLANHKDLHEIDLYANYNFPIGDMNLNVGVTDYLVAGGGDDNSIEFSNFDDDDSGQHLLEANVKLTGPESLPLTLQLNKNFFNESGKSFHTALSYPYSVGGIDLVGTIGGAKSNVVNSLTKTSEVGFYGVEAGKFGLTEISLSASKSFDFISGHSTTFKVMGAYNPQTEKVYPVVGISIWKASE